MSEITVRTVKEYKEAKKAIKKFDELNALKKRAWFTSAKIRDDCRRRLVGARLYGTHVRELRELVDRSYKYTEVDAPITDSED